MLFGRFRKTKALTGVLCMRGVKGGFFIFENFINFAPVKGAGQLLFNCSHNVRRSAGIPMGWGGGGGGGGGERFHYSGVS